MASKFYYLSDFYEEEISNAIVPEIYIDTEILSKENNVFQEKHHKVYRINGDLFYEDNRNQNGLQQFWLELNDQNEDYEDLIFEIKQNSYVVMVNSIILLSCYQWNTITDECPPKCLVCNIIIQDPNNHIKMDDHVDNLDKHKPLKKFNLHITRLIGDQYHCAVCNEVYELYDNTHLDSERHLERMLYATNRATDGVFDFEINNDNRSLNNDNCSVSNDNDARKKDTLSTSESGFDSDGFYDFNYFNSNNKSILRSYASIAKQSSTKTQTSVVEHVSGNKTFTIDSDSYHMIVRPNSKEFYCMLCILFGDVDSAAEHRAAEEHLKKLKHCEIMDIHDDHFIRKVTTKFYHCGTCNNLQLAGAVEAHLETHKKKRENSDKENEQKNETNENSGDGNVKENKMNKNGNKENKMNANSDTGNKRNVNNNRVLEVAAPSARRGPPAHGDVVIHRFNCNLRVSVISYNLICNRVVDYICLLCNFVSLDMTMHLRDPRHVVCLDNFPFQPFFGINLVRMLQQYAHCAICNVLMDAAVIQLHTSCQPHLFLLNKALNPTNHTVVMNPTNIDSMQSVNTKQPTEVNTLAPSEKVQGTPINNTEIVHEASVTETTDLNPTDLESDNLEYDIEDYVDIFKEFVYLKLKKYVLKVSSASYNSLVLAGDGGRYCFVCSYKVTKSFRGHVESKAHRNRMNKCKFITNYEKDLLRQVKLTYHCCMCNVLVRKSDIKSHLTWTVHKENAKFVKIRKHEHLNNTIKVEFQTEDACFNETEPRIQLVFKMKSGAKTSDNIGGTVVNLPPCKDGRARILNVSWDAWQGVSRDEREPRCSLCRAGCGDADAHSREDAHRQLVDTPVEKQYLPACVRKISKVQLNCVTCNLVFSSKGKSISQHMGGKKHLGHCEESLETAFTDVSSHVSAT